MSNQIRLGVIGMGNMGFAHAMSIAGGEIDGLSLAAVCDIDKSKAEAVGQIQKGIPFFTRYSDMLNAGLMDAVLIATPHPLHAQMAIDALESGMHVMLEKPADIAVSRVEQLNKTAEKSGKVFSIMLNQRTNPLFQKAREIVKSGQLGELKRTSWMVTNWYRTQRYYDSGGWRATWSSEGGGVLINQAPHNLDILQWICGMPQQVTAFCGIGKYHHIEVEDDVTAFLEYPNGATGIFVVSTGEYPGTNRFEISGTRGKLVLENAALKWWKLKENERDVCFESPYGFPEIETEYSEIAQGDAPEGHKILLQNFADAILQGEELLAPGTDGIFELMLSNAAYLSQWSGNKTVSLPLNTAEFDAHLAALQAKSKANPKQPELMKNRGYQSRWNVRW